MPSLRELQEAFAAGVLHERSQPACAWIAARGLAAERRLAIYRNNAREGFLKTLAATFPVLLRLAGEGWVRQTGRMYMSAHPSPSGNLHHIGERFAAFLSSRLEGGEYEYFADVAALEWAYQEVLVAADRPPFDVNALVSTPVELHERLAFNVRPAVRCVASAYPILAIWKANQPAASADGEEIRLDAGGSRVLIARRDDHVELRELSAATCALLQALARGESLLQAAQAATLAEPGADLSAALAQLIRLGALADFRIEPGAAEHERA